MQAVVLVGGRGTRLLPLTHTRPKPMLPVANRPMIEHIVGHLAAHGVTEIVLSLGYRPDAFMEAYPDGYCVGLPLHYAVEPEPLNTAGAVRFAALEAGIDGRFLVINGDILTDLDLGRLMAQHVERGAEVSISLHQVEDPSRYGVVPTEADGRVIEFVEKPPRESAPTNLINAGTYVFERSVLDRIPDRPYSSEYELFPSMAKDGLLYAFDGETYWIDTGTPQAYLQAQFDLIDGLRPQTVVAVHPEAKVDEDVRVARSAIGPGVVVDAGGQVVDSVVLPGARIGSGAVVERSIVGEGAEVGSGAHVLNYSVIGDSAVIEGDTRLDGARVAGEVE